MASLVQLITLLMAIFSARAIVAIPQPNPGCPATCGDLAIPFPFGITDGCYLDDTFLITCNNTHYNPPKTFHGNLQVLNISLDGSMRVSSYFASKCYNQSGLPIGGLTAWLTLSHFFISNTRNKFVAIGCDTVAVVQGSHGQNYTTGCVSLCKSIGSVINGSCSGIGCCQTSIPQGARDYSVGIISWNYSKVRDFNPCDYAFVVEEESFSFSTLDLKDLQNRSNVPVVIDWAVGNETCEEAKINSSSYACQDVYSECYNSINGPGYRCNCSSGYEGNPYLIGGCRDIDECETLKPCDGTCENLPGSFSCSCLKGYEGDGMKNGTGCQPKSQSRSSTLLNIALGISVGLTVILLLIAFILVGVQKRNITKVRADFFRKNGGIMLQNLLSRSENSVQTTKIFREEELKKATNNFNDMLVVGEGGFGTVYKGTLADNKIVAIKKSKLVDPSQIEQFVTEVKILSQIKHPNVVKLLGCCLETPVPLLVYEFITNKTLFHHLHDEGRVSSIPWELRLRIATETADALAHMHCTTQIIHRDIKSANILLNDDYTAKVSDFGISKLVPSGKTHLTTLVQGTYGYIDPEYFESGNLTEKSDVYSFGVILVELLTGQQVLSSERTEKNRSLARYFTSSLEEDCFFHILEDRVKREGNAEQLKRVAEIAKKCLKMKGGKRPTMEEVKLELEALSELEGHTLVEIQIEERELLLGKPLAYYDDNASSGLDSMRNLAAFQVDSGGR